VPRRLESRLAERRGGLERGQRARAAVEPQPVEAERDRPRGDDADGRPPAHEPADLRRAGRDQPGADASSGPGHEARAELHDDGPHRRCVPSPTTRYWRNHRSRYVTGPRGPGVQSTLIPVSGAPVSSNPSAKRVGACQNATVPRYAARNISAASASSVTMPAANPEVSWFAIRTPSSSESTRTAVTVETRSASPAHS